MGKIRIFTGDGYGRTPAALGEALMAAARGKRVVVIQFLKGRGLNDSAFQRQLEPEIKIFRFEKSEEDFFSLPEEKRREEAGNIRNGLNFAKKVLSTGECELLVLDEVLGLVAGGIIREEELEGVLAARGEGTDVTLTGVSMSESICGQADFVSKIVRVK
ncbi:MAG: cob(I)yrinic acid a,c-diamide adenosyltransferase [Eubacteriales bacterium]|nr:cob(I)yrinic acid a,c-diamide adenosyltransferase [Eubacteriales bacterium]